MSVPMLLVTRKESRTPYGAVTPVLSESVEVRDGAWWLCEGTENFLRNPIFALWSGVLPSSWGNDGTSLVERVEDATAPGGVKARVAPNPDSTGYFYSNTIHTESDYFEAPVGVVGSFLIQGWGQVRIENRVHYADGSPAVYAPQMIYELDGTRQWLPSGLIPTTPGKMVRQMVFVARGLQENTFDILAGQQEAKDHATPLTISIRAEGTLSVPLATTPAIVLIRTREDGSIHTHRADLSAGTFGEHGTVTHSSGTLTIGTTREVEVLGLLAYAAPISNGEMSRITGLSSWAWDALIAGPVSFPTGIIDRTPRQIVTIAGEPMLAYSVETQHSVKRPKGTATIRMPRPTHTAELPELRERWLNQPIEAQVGYDEDGGAQRVFTGRISKLRRTFDRGGYKLEVSATGWAALLDFPSEQDIVFPGLSRLYDIIRSLCRMRGVPMYSGELIRYPNSSTEVRLGGVEYVDEGKVIIAKRTSPLQWIVNTLALFGYYACDLPNGMFWWGRVMGKPAQSPVMTFSQGANVMVMSRDDDLAQMVTWWDLEGASYTDDDGVPNKVRSFPLEVPYSPYLDPPGYVRRGLTSPILVTSPMADASRNVAEINTAAPYEAESWRYAGTPGIQPGNVVALTSPLLELDNASRWVMSVDHSSSIRGIRTTWAGWQGAGTAQPGGDDSTEITVFTAPQHVGDEYLAHYAQPNPQSTEITFEITVPETYTALVIEGWGHGCNSFLIDGTSTESEVSKIEVWQGGEKAVGTATLPTMPENLEKLYPYGHPTDWQRYWQKFRLPVPGRLEPGIATVKLISGVDRRIADVFAQDDFEIRSLILVLTGIGYPALPGGGS